MPSLAGLGQICFTTSLCCTTLNLEYPKDCNNSNSCSRSSHEVFVDSTDRYFGLEGKFCKACTHNKSEPSISILRKYGIPNSFNTLSNGSPWTVISIDPAPKYSLRRTQDT